MSDFVQNIDCFLGAPGLRVRELFLASFPDGKFRCATDGRIVALDETGVDNPDLLPATTGVYDQLVKFRSLEYTEAPFPDLGEAPNCARCGATGDDPKVCWACDGDGSFECDHCGTECECEKCDGTGYHGFTSTPCFRCNGTKRSFRSTEKVAMNGVNFSSFYLSLIDRLPGRQIYFSADRYDPLKFTYATGSGYLMRIR